MMESIVAKREKSRLGRQYFPIPLRRMGMMLREEGKENENENEVRDKGNVWS